MTDHIGDMNPRLLILAACAGLCACAGAPAEEQAVPRGRINVFISPMGEPFHGGADAAYPIDVWFNRVDANHDGVLTEEEFEADAVTFFKTLDLNHDGRITRAELPKTPAQKLADKAARKARHGKAPSADVSAQR